MDEKAKNNDWIWISINKDCVQEKANGEGKTYCRVKLPKGTRWPSSDVNLSGATFNSPKAKPSKFDEELCGVCVHSGPVKIWVPAEQKEMYIEANQLSIAVAMQRKQQAAQPQNHAQERLKIVFDAQAPGFHVNETKLEFTDSHGRTASKMSVTVPDGTVVDGKDCSGRTFITNYVDWNADKSKLTVTFLADRQVTLTKATFDDEGKFSGYDKFQTTTDALRDAIMGPTDGQGPQADGPATEQARETHSADMPQIEVDMGALIAEALAQGPSFDEIESTEQPAANMQYGQAPMPSTYDAMLAASPYQGMDPLSR